MSTRPHAARTAFRRAVWASVALHALAAVGLLVMLRPQEAKPRGPKIDTRAPHVQVHLAEIAPEVEVRPEPPPARHAEAPKSSAPPPDTPAPSGPPGPFAPAVPRTLPPELVALLRKPLAPAAVAHDPSVKPAGGTGTPALAVPAMHGALRPAQTVVYLLDGSGSMGALGKFAAARAALHATLARQPATVRFQVVVYDGTARALTAGGAVPATPANVDAALAKLATVEPRGKSNHLVALRAALDSRPDVVVWLTDADDLTAGVVRPVLRASGRPVPVCVGLVTAAGVQQPRELK